MLHLISTLPYFVHPSTFYYLLFLSSSLPAGETLFSHLDSSSLRAERR